MPIIRQQHVACNQATACNVLIAPKGAKLIRNNHEVKDISR